MSPARLVLGLVALLGALVGHAHGAPPQDPRKQACADAYDNSQLLRDRGQLGLARAQLLVCQSACPERLAADCTQWLASIEAQLPTIVVRAVDAAGAAVPARLRIDGQAEQALPATPVVLEPGRHRIALERVADGAVVEQVVELSDSDRERLVVATFSAPETTSAEPPPAGAVTLLTIGGGAVLVAAVLAIKGHADRSELHDCRPHCAQEDVDAIATTWTASGVVAGAGGAVLGAGLLWWLLAEPGAADAEAAWFSPTPFGLTARF